MALRLRRLQDSLGLARGTTALNLSGLLANALASVCLLVFLNAAQAFVLVRSLPCPALL